jgi:hypothetical protein
MADQRRTSSHQAGRGERWVSLLGGPLAAGAQLALSVPLLPLSCAVEWRTIFHLVSLVAALAALGAGLLAWQQLQEQRTTQPAWWAHQHLMSYGGLAANTLALAVIGARWLTALSLEACVRTL